MNERPWLNHGGDTPDNPLISGSSLTVRLFKQDQSETLRQAWVNVGKAVHRRLTGIAVINEFDITIAITVGIELLADSVPVRNVIHFTTSQHRHARAVIYCATQPSVMIALDGYNASNPTFPLIYPLHVPS